MILVLCTRYPIVNEFLVDIEPIELNPLLFVSKQAVTTLKELAVSVSITTGLNTFSSTITTEIVIKSVIELFLTNPNPNPSAIDVPSTCAIT